MNELVELMRKVLSAERRALRRLDVEAMARTNAMKELVLRRLEEASNAERMVVCAALATELEENLALLEAARSILRNRQYASLKPLGVALGAGGGGAGAPPK